MDFRLFRSTLYYLEVPEPGFNNGASQVYKSSTRITCKRIRQPTVSTKPGFGPTKCKNGTTESAMEPDVEMGVVLILPEASRGTSKPLLELAMRGEIAAFLDEMGKHPLGVTAGVEVYEDRSALHMAALHGRTEIVSLIMSAPEASSQIVNARDRFGYTPLHLAVRAEHEDVVRILATSSQTRILAACDSSGSSSQQDEEGRDCDGFTPLHLAAVSGNIAIVKLILQEFACQELPVNIHATTWQGTTALDIAKRGRHLKLVDILESWDVKWLQLERQKSANSVNAILVGAALVATITFGCMLQPPLGLSIPETSTYSSIGAGAPALFGEDGYRISRFDRVRVGWFLVCTAFSFSFSIVSLVIGITAVLPSASASLKREVQQLRSSVLRASISLFVSIFFLLWASQVGGIVVAFTVGNKGIVNEFLFYILLLLPVIVLAFVLRHIVLLKVTVKVKKWTMGLLFVLVVVVIIVFCVGVSVAFFLDTGSMDFYD